MKIKNQKPIEVKPIYINSIKGDYDPVSSITETLIKPLFNPLIANTPVTIENNGSIMDEKDLTNLFLTAHDDNVNMVSELALKELFNNTLLYFDKTTNLTIANLFAIQSATKEKLPFPTDKVIYTPTTDVIPTSREFLAGKCDYDKWFTALAFYARPQTLGFYFANEVVFNNFKTWLNNQTQMLNSIFPLETNQMLNEFQKLTLDSLTESLLIRKDDSDGCEEYSFARIIVNYLMSYNSQISPAEYGVLPFNTSELYNPKSIVFVNIEKHGRATAKQVKDEWDMINKSLNMPVKIVNKNKLVKLTGALRNIKKVQANAASSPQNNKLMKSQNAKFRLTAPKTVDIVKLIKKVMDKMAFVNKSENSYKSIKMSFSRANRRDPLDFNRKGKIVSTKYKPDLHIYLDTSGSISEENYQDSIKACIKMARTLNINLYFNSFSHVLSQPSQLQIKDKSTRQAYVAFQKVPKVSGGTDFEQIWHYINNDKKRKRELSIIITDFEYQAPNKYVEHPKNLYYIPCSNMDWDRMTKSAERFVSSMATIDTNCRKHILM